jgi:hypothetical protein
MSAQQGVQGLQRPQGGEDIVDAGECPICLQKFCKRDGLARITCGSCNNSHHVCCSTKATLAKCPLCRQPCDRPPPDRQPGVSALLEPLQNDFVTVSINNETGREITFQLPEGSTISQLAQRLATKLVENADGGADYGTLNLDPSRIVVFFQGVEVACTHVLQSQHRTSLSATIEEEGWQDHITVLYRHRHDFLADILQDELVEGDGGVERYELGATVKLCRKLLNLGPDRSTNRGGSSKDDEQEQDAEITAVLLEAKRDGRSMYDALKAEFF